MNFYCYYVGKHKNLIDDLPDQFVIQRASNEVIHKDWISSYFPLNQFYLNQIFQAIYYYYYFQFLQESGIYFLSMFPSKCLIFYIISRRIYALKLALSKIFKLIPNSKIYFNLNKIKNCFLTNFNSPFNKSVNSADKLGG